MTSGRTELGVAEREATSAPRPRSAVLNVHPGHLWVGAAICGAAASLAVAPGLDGTFGAVLAPLMVAIAFVDARRFVIPDELTISGFALGLLQAAVGSEDGIAAALANAGMRAAALAAAFWLLRFTYRWLRGRDGLGFGDVKLAGVAGVWLTVTTIPIAIEVAALGGLAIYVVRQHRLGRPLRRGSRLPFGAFFAPAIWCAWMVQILMAGR